MNKTKFNTVVLRLVSVVLIAAMSLCTVGCNNKNDVTETPQTEVGAATELGTGALRFNFNVTDKDGNVTKFIINTDKTVVGDALLDHGLIAGDEGDFGLYVKQVNGISADYDTDGTYWAFYINGEYASTGVDKTTVVTGDTYEFRAEK